MGLGGVVGVGCGAQQAVLADVAVGLIGEVADGGAVDGEGGETAQWVIGVILALAGLGVSLASDVAVTVVCVLELFIGQTLEELFMV